MNFIKEKLKNADITLTELLECCEQVKQNGGVVAIKLDGGRTENQYTVFITFQDEMIRADMGDLREAILNVLMKYAEM